ncbi:MAG: bifunctional metallophosphatase/5'-nucleotidase [Gemmatimonadales bacterium]|nr:bifunctional metallophosphatase/5'-nucleotidase [Gemmatimonadales bacterium]
MDKARKPSLFRENIHVGRLFAFVAVLLLVLAWFWAGVSLGPNPAMAAAGSEELPPPEVGPGPYNLTLFHTNDSHSNFLPRPAVWRDDGRLVGGVIPLAWHLARERETTAADIFLDAGDFMTGNPVCTMVVDGVMGGAIPEMMNGLGYTAGLIGNHEFDIGRRNLGALVKRFNFPLLAADIMNEAGEPEFRSEPVLLESGGLRVGILGVSCAGMEEVVTLSRLEGVRLVPQAEVVRAQAAKLDPRTDLLVLLTHNGVDGDRKLARELAGSGIDVIVGGHSHTRLKEPELEAGILIVQAGSGWTNLGRLDLVVENDRIVRYRGRLITLWADGTSAGPDLTEVIGRYEAMMDREFKRRIGTLVQDWRRGRGETNVGSWLADQIRIRAETEVALLNSGTIRKGLNAGPITALDIHEMLPFSNTLVTMELTGDDLAAVVQRNADSQVDGNHGILQVSGIQYEFRAAGGGKSAEVMEILVGGEPVAPGSTYTVAMPDYVAMMGNVYLGIEPPQVHEVGVNMTQAIIEAVEASGPISAGIEGRIRRLD